MTKEASAALLGFRRILITGANGFVGRMMVEALQQAAADDVRFLLAVRTPSNTPDLPQVQVDLLDGAGVERIVGDFAPDLIIHLAAQAWAATSIGMAGETWGVNCGGSLALARAVAAATPEATFFFVSSAEVYGLSFNEGPVHESMALLPLSAYARSKAAAEAMLADVLPASSRLIVVRPSNHSGAGQAERFVIPSFAAQIARIEQGIAEPTIRVGNLSACRDFLDARDVVDAYMTLLRAAAKLSNRATFNVGSGKAVAVESILSQLLDISGVHAAVLIDKDRQRDSEIAIATNDASRLSKVTGWRPRHTLPDMLRAVIEDQRQKQRSPRT